MELRFSTFRRVIVVVFSITLCCVSRILFQWTLIGPGRRDPFWNEKKTKLGEGVRVDSGAMSWLPNFLVRSVGRNLGHPTKSPVGLWVSSFLVKRNERLEINAVGLLNLEVRGNYQCLVLLVLFCMILIFLSMLIVGKSFCVRSRIWPGNWSAGSLQTNSIWFCLWHRHIRKNDRRCVQASSH